MELSRSNWSGSLRVERDEIVSPVSPLFAFRGGSKCNTIEPGGLMRRRPCTASGHGSHTRGIQDDGRRSPSAPGSPLNGVRKCRSLSFIRGEPSCCPEMRPMSAFTASGSSGVHSKGWGPSTSCGSMSQISPRSSSTVSDHQAVILKLHGMDHSASDASTIRTEFRKKLVRRYRNIVSAWCQLDLQRTGRCLLPDVCRVAKECGFVCHVQTLWKALDNANAGFVCFQDLDADVAHLLRGFAEVATASCGSAHAAWQEHFGLAQLRCRKGPFKAGARKLGYTGDIERVFTALNAEHMQSGIVFDDFSLLDKWFIAQRSKRDLRKQPSIWDIPTPNKNPTIVSIPIGQVSSRSRIA